MKLIRLQRIAATIACLGMMIPTAAFSAEPTAQISNSLDVALGAGGVFRGQVVNAQGAPQQQVEVAMLYQGREVVRTTTDERGVFAAQGLRGGEYQVVAQNQQVSYRLWSAGQAPPAARPAALMITGADAVNGQFGNGFGGFFGNPLVIAGIVAAAVAIPVAVHNANLDTKSSS